MTLLVSMPSAASGEEALSPAEGGITPISNVAGKKLIRGAREIRHASQAMMEIKDPEKKAAFLQEKVASWQDKGIDGVMFFLHHGRWWQVPGPTYDELKPEIDAFKSVKDWGRLTDNFMWTYSTVWTPDGKVQDWFDDGDWQAVCANTRLAARLAKECGFKGILLDWEQYGGRGKGIWKYPFSYKRYADEGYKAAGEAEPRSFLEIAARVRQRGNEYGEALTSAYPDIVLMVAPSLYGGIYKETVTETGGDLSASGSGLLAAFIDGLLLGLGKQASLVAAFEGTYLDSTYRDMLIARDRELRLSLVLSKAPELARKRISFCAAIWTDAGFAPLTLTEDGFKGIDFSATDLRVNQRDPERHKHAAHNALAVSDKYAWLYGEKPWITLEETPLMRQYWQANVDAHEPMDLGWAPETKWDLTDYSAKEREMALEDAAFWAKAEKDGWKVAVQLPIHWRFRFSVGKQLRFRKHWPKGDFDDSSWPLISILKCWQSQSIPASGQGVYRTNFDVPTDVDPDTQEVVLAFGAYSAGPPATELGDLASWADICVNGKPYPLEFPEKKQMLDVSGSIKPGQSNRVGIRVINASGPAFLMGHVKLLVREKQSN